MNETYRRPKDADAPWTPETWEAHQTKLAEDAIKAKVAALPVHPTGWRVLVKTPKPVEKTAGGIIIPTKVQDEEKILTMFGEVVELGPVAYKNRPDVDFGGPWCKEGDAVLLSKYAGTKIEIDGEQYRIINDDEVQGVVNDTSRVKRA